MRARNIKPGFFKNSKLGKCTPYERLLFIGLWCMSDREGFFETDIDKILIELFPYDRKITNANINKMLCNLMSLHLITFNDMYGHIPKFGEHQRPHPHEAKSRLSDESKNILINQCNDMPCNVTKCPSDIRNEDIRNEDIRNPDIRNEDTTTFLSLWNFLVEGNLSRASLTPKRKTAISARLKDNGDITYWESVIKKLLESKFCLGDNDRGWKADIDFLLKPDTHIKVIEGKYSNNGYNTSTGFSKF